jgi:hypothetical protein
MDNRDVGVSCFELDGAEVADRGVTPARVVEGLNALQDRRGHLPVHAHGSDERQIGTGPIVPCRTAVFANIAYTTAHYP